MPESGVTSCSKLFSLCTAVTLCGAMSLFVLLASWALDGGAYKGSLLENCALSLLLLSVTVGAARNLASRRIRQAESREFDPS